MPVELIGVPWSELEVIVAAGLSDPGCAGCSVVIYNPDLDPDRASAERIIGFLETVLGATATRRS